MKTKKIYCKNCSHWSSMLRLSSCQVTIETIEDKKATKAFGDKWIIKETTGDFRKLNKNNNCEFYKEFPIFKSEKENHWWDFRFKI